MKMKLMIPLVLVVLIFTGCAPPGFIPQPTKKPVKQGDVVGVWHLKSSRSMTQTNSAVRCDLTMDFASDGSYSQQITVEGTTNVVTHTGAWKLEGSHITFSDLLQEGWDKRADVGIWEKRGADWYMIDVNLGRGIGLFGSLHGDPDSFQWMERKR